MFLFSSSLFLSLLFLLSTSIPLFSSLVSFRLSLLSSISFPPCLFFSFLPFCPFLLSSSSSLIFSLFFNIFLLLSFPFLFLFISLLFDFSGGLFSPFSLFFSLLLSISSFLCLCLSVSLSLSLSISLNHLVIANERFSLKCHYRNCANRLLIG